MTASHLREVSSDGVTLPGDVAAELYAARLQRGVDLRDVAKELRIHRDKLLAIEEGRFADLPGPTYVIGFLRSYARYLDLDADDLVRRFKTETTEFDAHQDLYILEPYDEGRVPTGALITMGLLLVVGAYGGWYYLSNSGGPAVDRVPEVPDRMITATQGETAPQPEITLPTVAAAPDPVPQAAPVSAVETAADEVAAETDAPEAAAPDVVRSDEPLAAILATAIAQQPEPAVQEDPAHLDEAAPKIVPQPRPAVEATPETAPDDTAEAVTEAAPVETASLQAAVPAPVIEAGDYLPRVFGQANADSVITLRARAESWVQVTGLDNELLLTRILRPGDIYHVPDRPGLVLMTGNAGGIEILVGGKPAPALGEAGKVRRRVALDPARLLAGTAVDP